MTQHPTASKSIMLCVLLHVVGIELGVREKNAAGHIALALVILINLEIRTGTKVQISRCCSRW